MTIDISKFSNDKLNEAQPFFITLPNGVKTEGRLYVYSMKSDKAIKALDSISRAESGDHRNPMRRAVNKDITLCSKLIDRIENILISDEDNGFGFEVENGEIVSNSRNISILTENFPFIREQVAQYTNNDAFFYGLAD